MVAVKTLGLVRGDGRYHTGPYAVTVMTPYMDFPRLLAKFPHGASPPLHHLLLILLVSAPVCADCGEHGHGHDALHGLPSAADNAYV